MATRRASTSSTAIPVPYGLIRFGVAPDHQSLKAVSKRYDKVAESAGVDFIGNVTVGRDVSIAELLDLYDAVILATGAPHDRKLGIPGEDLPGVVGSAEFVGWYNGHPEFADLDPPLDGAHAAVSATAMSRSTARASCRRRRHEFEGSDIVGHALDALDAVGDPNRHHPRPPRPAPDRDDAQGARRARPSRSRGAGRRSRRFPARRSRRAARARPAQVGQPAARLRRPRRRTSPSASSSISSPSRCAIEGDGKVERIIVERTELDESGARARHRRDLRDARVADRHLHRLLDLADRRTCRSRGGKFVNDRGRDRRPALSPSAGRGAGRPARSAPTVPTAMKSPTRSPPRCRRDSSATGRAPKASSACSQAAA